VAGYVISLFAIKAATDRCMGLNKNILSRDS